MNGSRTVEVKCHRLGAKACLRMYPCIVTLLEPTVDVGESSGAERAPNVSPCGVPVSAAGLLFATHDINSNRRMEVA